MRHDYVEKRLLVHVADYVKLGALTLKIKYSKKTLVMRSRENDKLNMD
jgi:hypothetical protein